MLSNLLYDDVILIDYDPKTNLFYDEDGYEITNILDMLTPNDIMLFKNDYHENLFLHRNIRGVACLIYVRGSEEYYDLFSD